MKVGIVGASGYSGEVLVKLLLRHPKVTLAAVTSRSQAGKPLAAVIPSVRGADQGLKFTDSDVSALAASDIALFFLALPHGAAATYAKALVATTPRDQLVESAKAGKDGTANPRDLARIEHEMHTLEKDFLLMEDTYGRTVLELTLARGYLKKLLDNGRVVRYLAQKHPELLPEFQRIVEATALET